MINQIKKTGKALEKLGDKVLLSIAFAIFWGLTYYSLRYTEILKPDTEIPMTIPDNVLINLLIFVGITALFFLLRTILLRKCNFNSNKLCQRFIGVITILIGMISVGWVAICHVVPRADGASLCLVAQLMMEGADFGFMNPPGYMSYNPHQFSLLSVIHLLFSIFGINNYQAFQYMNALCMPLLFYSGYKLIQLICAKWEPVLYYTALFISCLPLFFYVPYVYGEITSTTFTLVLMWQVVRYCKTGKKTCFLWGTLAIVFACIMRMNSLIVLVAAGIVLLLHALRNAKWQAAAWLAGMTIAVFATDTGIQAYYENISDKEILDGIPYISYVLMGLEDKEQGPGWFNGTNYTQLMAHNYDTELTAADNAIAVKERLKVFWNDKAYGIDFFRRKILSQWNSPAYHSLYETGSFDCEKEELPEVVRKVYYDNEPTVSAFMNRYQFVLYLCTAVMASFALFHRKKTASEESTLENHILIIAIVGGFLFSALWEAMSRYVISYVVYMIPLAAIGMWQLQQGVNALLNRLLSQK